ncbi:MAG: thioredoxin fold domain-containing protein [Tannerella sp.]|nr:thioredoxin fold domain-containing protein [Tannerella sp.]
MISVLCSAQKQEAESRKQEAESRKQEAENQPDTAKAVVAPIAAGEIITLTKADFLTNIYNYEKTPDEWVYEGSLPCIIDFYSDWCGPCKRVEPILKQMAKNYAGRIIIYKINIDKERELATAFGVRSIPTYLFVNPKEQPKSAVGALSQETFEQIIKEHLLK